MDEHILTKVFLDVYRKIKLVNYNIQKEDYDRLEKALEEYLFNVVGYRSKNNYKENLSEIIIYFENIIYNTSEKGYMNIEDQIKHYIQVYNTVINTHYYVKIFINTMKRLYSKSYDGKPLGQQSFPYQQYEDILGISHKNNSLTLRKTARNEIEMPATYILNIDDFEAVLKEYISSIKNSDSFYNIFDNEGFLEVPEEDKIQLIFESTMLNATNLDLINIVSFFRMYTDFINNHELKAIRTPQDVGYIFDSKFFVMLKRATLRYETPYYLSFLLIDKRVELPNIRLGIENSLNGPVAHIIATQSSQADISLTNLAKIQEEIKENIPQDSSFRFFNPTHLISLLMAFGILNGMGIKDIDIKGFLPFRYKKTVADRQMDDEERDQYLTRLINKNLITYMRLVSLADGIDVVSYPEIDMGLKLKLQDKIEFKDEFLQNIYNMCFKLGEKYSQESINKKSR